MDGPFSATAPGTGFLTNQPVGGSAGGETYNSYRGGGNAGNNNMMMGSGIGGSGGGNAAQLGTYASYMTSQVNIPPPQQQLQQQQQQQLLQHQQQGMAAYATAALAERNMNSGNANNNNEPIRDGPASPASFTAAATNQFSGAVNQGFGGQPYVSYGDGGGIGNGNGAYRGGPAAANNTCGPSGMLNIPNAYEATAADMIDIKNKLSTQGQGTVAGGAGTDGGQQGNGTVDSYNQYVAQFGAGSSGGYGAGMSAFGSGMGTFNGSNRSFPMGISGPYNPFGSIAATAALLGKTQSQLAAKQKKAAKKKEKGKPKRPLSAYNLFFKDERARILESIPSPLNGKKDKLPKVKAEGDVEGENAKNVSANHTNSSTKRKKTPHGKIGFENLAKIIGKNWKELDPTKIDHYKMLADKDMKRYKDEMELFLTKKQKEEEHRRDAGEQDVGERDAKQEDRKDNSLHERSSSETNEKKREGSPAGGSPPPSKKLKAKNGKQGSIKASPALSGTHTSGGVPIAFNSMPHW